MPSILELEEQAPSDAEVDCCPDHDISPAASPASVAIERSTELVLSAALDRRDIELLCGVER